MPQKTRKFSTKKAKKIGKTLLDKMHPNRIRVNDVMRSARATDALMERIEKNHSKGKPLPKYERKQLKRAIVAMERKIRVAMKAEEKYMLRDRNGLRKRMSNKRVHDLENAIHIVNGRIELLEHLGMLESGFKDKCLEEVGIINNH